LGLTYRDAGRLDKAFECYALSQAMDQTDCSLQMALCYLYGIGTQKNNQRCLEVLQNIADHVFMNCEYDIDEANYLLGKIHLEGIMVDKSIEKARHYLTAANKDGDHNPANDLLNVIGKKSDRRLG
jgi:uncharacterized protein